jgi:IS66 Orf2 like protein
MLPQVSAAVRVFLCTRPTDMRKSFDAFPGLVQECLGQDPLTGHLFLFLKQTERDWPGPEARAGLSVAPGERVGREHEVHHQCPEVGTVAERVEGVLGAEGVGAAVARADRLVQQADRPGGFLLAFGG